MSRVLWIAACGNVRLVEVGRPGHFEYQRRYKTPSGFVWCKEPFDEDDGSDFDAFIAGLLRDGFCDVRY
jgi:hypothetical protein